MAMPTLDDVKARERKRCAQSRDDLRQELREAAAHRIADIGLGLTGLDVAGLTVSAYCAIGSELDPMRLMVRLAEAGAHLCLPVIQPKGHPLLFRRWAPGEPLVERMWGIREPAADADVVDPQIMLVPLLAFDAAGWRLGYGGGYYDRTLAKLRASRPVLAIGLAYDEQEMVGVPVGPHDQRLDWVLTPSGARKVGRVCD